VKPPIIVGDDTSVVEIYPSIEAATRRMEAIDVEDGLYRAWDSEGLVLIPTPLPKNRATLVRSDPPEYRPDQLRFELEQTAHASRLVRKPREWLGEASISLLIEALIESERAWEARRRERSLMNRLRRRLGLPASSVRR
jgi:hypothetical protein